MELSCPNQKLCKNFKRTICTSFRIFLEHILVCGSFYEHKLRKLVCNCTCFVASQLQFTEVGMLDAGKGRSPIFQIWWRSPLLRLQRAITPRKAIYRHNLTNCHIQYRRLASSPASCASALGGFPFPNTIEAAQHPL